MEALAFGVGFIVFLFWATTTRAFSFIFFAALALAGFWLFAAVSVPLTREQLLSCGLLTWWVPLGPWAALRFSWTSVEVSRILQNGLRESRWGETQQIRIWRFLLWWPMARVALGDLGQAHLVFCGVKDAIMVRFTLASPALSRAPWFYGERDPLWPAWLRGMRCLRNASQRFAVQDEHPRRPSQWHYWGGARGIALLTDERLRADLDARKEMALLSRPGHLTITFTADRFGDQDLDALERIARRCAELSSGLAVAAE